MSLEGHFQAPWDPITPGWHLRGHLGTYHMVQVQQSKRYDLSSGEREEGNGMRVKDPGLQRRIHTLCWDPDVHEGKEHP